MKISIYELMGLIKDDKAPKKIKMCGETYKLLDIKKDYINSNKNTCLSTELQKLLKYNFLTTVLQTDIEILTEENDEWEDIEELQEEGNFKFYNKPTGMSEEVAKILDAYLETLIIKINSLIKNQKRIIEKLEEK